MDWTGPDHGTLRPRLPVGGAVPRAIVAPDLLTPQELSPLREEASKLRASASRRERQVHNVASGGRILCTLRNWCSTDGKAAKHLLRALLAPRLCTVLCDTVIATHWSYLYYGRGDFLGLHRDHPTCELTVLVWLSGPSGALQLHPELAGMHDEEIARIAERWHDHPPGGTSIDLRQGPLILRGSEVPHNRLPHPYDDELVVATFCFVSDSSQRREGEP